MPPIVMTNTDFRFIVGEQLKEAGVNLGPIIIEPEVKNTAPAILSACLFAFSKNKDSILLVAPSDHYIPDTSTFQSLVKKGTNHVFQGKMVTFGIQPSHAETGYGYLKLDDDGSDEEGASLVTQFIEKPKKQVAKQMLKEDKYLWNSGIFMFRAVDMILAFEKFRPNMLKIVKNAVETSSTDLDFLRLNPQKWNLLDEISIDFAIMEKARNLVAIPFKAEWSDLGEWKSVWAQLEKDHLGVALSDNATSIDCKDSLLRSESEKQHIVGLGLENIVAVAMPDAVLVTKI